MDRKTLSRISIKAADEGVATARFATLGEIDADGDVTEPGAFGRQRVPVSAYGHTSWQGALPVGVAEIRESGNEALADVKFFMDTTHGADTFATVKALGELGEWSYGFKVGDARDPTEEERARGVKRVLKRLKVHEVSPVLRGVGVGTQTLAAKCDGCGVKLPKSKGAEPSDRVPFRVDVTFVRPNDPAVEELAGFAASVGHKLLSFPGKLSAPAVKWFGADPKGRAGFYRETEHRVHLDLDLRGRALVEVALHEVAHLGQWANRKAFDEADAHRFAGRWTDAVLRAHRLTGGLPHLVTRRRDSPAWHGLAKGTVVLHDGKAWAFYPQNKGPAWTPA